MLRKLDDALESANVRAEAGRIVDLLEPEFNMWADDPQRKIGDHYEINLTLPKPAAAAVEEVKRLFREATWPKCKIEPITPANGEAWTHKLEVIYATS